MKMKGSDIEFYREALARLQQEKAAYAEENQALREELRVMSESNRQEIAELRSTLETMRLTIQDLTKTNKELVEQLNNVTANLKLARGKRFAPSTEQANMLNNRRTDVRAEEKSDFDGTPSGSSSQKENVDVSDPSSAPARKKKKSEGRKPSLEEYGCQETIVHKLGEYFELPEGAVYKTRNGDIEIHVYESFEYVPGKIIRHEWHTATYIDALGYAHNTLPKEKRVNPVDGCPFSPEMLAFIMVEKYAYHTSKNRIKNKLRAMGANFATSTFIRYYQLSEKALRDMLEPTFKEAIVNCLYLMIDETCELVGVIDKNTGITEYMKKYLWAFFNKEAGLVWYLYEHGSRAREVVSNVLADFKGAFTSDGYAAYKAFGNSEEYPDIVHCGCWTHARRMIIEAMGVATDICHTLINDIGELFANEKLFTGLTNEERAEKRRRLSLPVFNRILSMVRRISKNDELMGRALLKKAVTYILNQEETLRNAILEGRAEISNNHCEQRIRPIKINLKNCQNIGSESAAENAAFMHSLAESCRLNNVDFYKYLCSLFRILRTPPDDVGKRALLPDQWTPQMLKAM